MTMPATTATTFDVEALIADSSHLPDLLADDIRWVEVDQRSQPHAPAIYRGRDEVLQMLGEAHERGIVSQVLDGFAHGDRAALAILCTYPGGAGEVRCNALLHLRD